MKFRHEYKFQLSQCDFLTVRARLLAVLMPDANADMNYEYKVRSIYFDSPNDRALREKIDGVNMREKFRIRFYNGDLSLINIEKKSKINGLSNKVSERITKEEAICILDGIPILPQADRPLLTELIFKMKCEQLRPKTIVDYSRVPFVFPAGNIRVTLDRAIRTGKANGSQSLLPEAVTIPCGTQGVLLEVKYNEFLPDVVRDIVQMGTRQAGAFSKYAVCRTFG